MPLGAHKAAIMGVSGVSTGDVVLIASNSSDTTDLSSIDFTSGIDSTYGGYIFKWYNINPATEDYNFTFNGSIDGGSNYNVTKTTTAFTAYHAEADNEAALGYDASRDLAQSTDFMQLGWNIGSGADESASGELHLFNPSSTTYVKHFMAITQYMFSSNYSVQTFTAGYFNSTDNIDAIQFKMSSGNLDGLIKMWGVK